jgi:hypothetical protein
MGRLLDVGRAHRDYLAAIILGFLKLLKALYIDPTVWLIHGRDRHFLSFPPPYVFKADKAQTEPDRR